jgi:hypothetical protein
MFWASVCDKLDLPSGPGQEDWMTVTFKLQLADGTPGTSPATAPRSKRLERRQHVGRAVFVTARWPGRSRIIAVWLRPGIASALLSAPRVVR